MNTTNNEQQNTTMKLIIIAVFALAFTASSAFSNHPSLQGSALTGEEIYANMFDLEGQVIKIEFPSNNPKQISKEYFSLNYGSGNQVAVVLLPSEVAKKFFSPNSKATLPRTLFVQVALGELTNEYGATEQGPILTGVGTKIHRGMGGAVEFKW